MTIDRRSLVRSGLLGAAGALMGCAVEPSATPAARDGRPTAQPSPAAGHGSDRPSPASGAASGEPSGPTPEPAPSASRGQEIALLALCREAWGAERARPGGRPHTVEQITVHHSAAVLGDNSNAPRRLRQHQALHQDQNGWIDIAYHVAVDRNGNVYELRDAALAGDTGTDYDPAGHFLVLCEGNFDQETPTAAQVEGVARLCAYAYRRYGLRGAPGASISGHRDHVATACPGRNLYRRLDEIGARTHELLEAGGVGLSVWCGDGARARVAEIEAGQA